jgi:methanogenic corrinoid protein MtbC1
MDAVAPGARVAGRKRREQGHACALFRSKDEEYRVLVPFVKEGIERGEKNCHIIDPALRADHLGRLAAGGIKVAAAQESGQLEILDWGGTYLCGGRFDMSAMLARVEKMLTTARDEGFPLTRLVGHAEWALEKRPGVGDLIEYEARADEVLASYPDAVLCAYDRSQFGAGVAMDALRTHPLAIIDGVLRDNPSFVPPGDLLARRRTQPTSILRDRYLTALLAGSRVDALDIVVEEGLWLDIPVASLYLRVVQPAQYAIGRLWRQKRISVAQEHLATEISRLALQHLRQHLCLPTSRGKRAVVACVEGEFHDLGARMVADFLEMAGFAVRFLGANVPTDDLVAFVREDSPELLALSTTMRTNLGALRRTITAVREGVGTRVRIAAGGQVFARTPALWQRLAVDIRVNDVCELATAARQLLRAGR